MKSLKIKVKKIIQILLREPHPPQAVVAGIFDDEETFLKAAQTAQGIKDLEAITPYPVHGLEEALKIKRSWIPWITLIFGLLGLSFGLFLTWYTSVMSWPLIVGGKPFFSLPAFIPVMFECTILFSAIATVGSLFFICDLPKHRPPLIDIQLTSHKFALFCPIEKNNKEEVEKKLKELGSEKIIVAQF